MAADPIADVVHELRGSAGSIAMALSTLLEQGDDDPQFRWRMLTIALQEVQRLSATAAALPVLVGAEPRTASVDEVLADAAAAARSYDVKVRVSSEFEGRVAVAPDALALLCVIVADVGGEVVLRGRSDGPMAVFDIGRLDGAPVRADRAVIRALIGAASGSQVTVDSGVAFSVPMVP